MQITNTYKDRIALLDEIFNINNARELIYDLRWPDSTATTDPIELYTNDGFLLLGNTFDYLYDLARVKFMIYDILSAVAVDS